MAEIITIVLLSIMLLWMLYHDIDWEKLLCNHPSDKCMVVGPYSDNEDYNIYRCGICGEMFLRNKNRKIVKRRYKK